MSIITRINKAEKRIVDLYNKLKKAESSSGGGVPTLQQVTESGNTTDQVIVSSNNMGILSSLVRVIQNINVVDTTGVRLFNTGAIQIQNSPSSGVTIYADNTTTNRALQVPDESGTLMVSKYKVYKALLTQSGTDAPVATVLQNTLGVIPIFSYDSPGFYQMEFPEGTFVEDKTLALIQNNTILGKCLTSCYVAVQNLVIIRTLDDSFTDADGKLYKTSILIEIHE